MFYFENVMYSYTGLLVRYEIQIVRLLQLKLIFVSSKLFFSEFKSITQHKLTSSAFVVKTYTYLRVYINIFYLVLFFGQKYA